MYQFPQNLHTFIFIKHFFRTTFLHNNPCKLTSAVRCCSWGLMALLEGTSAVTAEEKEESVTNCSSPPRPPPSVFGTTALKCVLGRTRYLVLKHWCVNSTQTYSQGRKELRVQNSAPRQHSVSSEKPLLCGCFSCTELFALLDGTSGRLEGEVVEH